MNGATKDSLSWWNKKGSIITTVGISSVIVTFLNWLLNDVFNSIKDVLPEKLTIALLCGISFELILMIELARGKLSEKIFIFWMKKLLYTLALISLVIFIIYAITIEAPIKYCTMSNTLDCFATLAMTVIARSEATKQLVYFGEANPEKRPLRIDLFPP